MSLNKPLMALDEFNMLYRITPSGMNSFGSDKSTRLADAEEHYEKNRAKRKRRENEKRRQRNKIAKKSRRKNRR